MIESRFPLPHTLALLDDHGPRFLEVPRGVRAGAVTILGVPYDGTTSFRPGARSGPDSLRVASQGIETYSPTQDRDYGDHAVCDVGNLVLSTLDPEDVVDRTERAVGGLLAGRARPLLLGGEHTVSTGAVTAVKREHPDLLLVQLDAHADLREEFNGEPHSHACTMRRCLERTGGPLLQCGIRSGTRDEFAEMRATGRLVPPEPEALAAAIARLGERPIYFTCDLDVFDPAVFPGTGTPEPGGIDWPRFEALLAAVPQGRIVAADAVELAPPLDATGNSSVLAAKVVRELILRLCDRG